ncbi:hypothetical protein RCL1_002061 [Eukaryota sp. TZLM3-RCL]
MSDAEFDPFAEEVVDEEEQARLLEQRAKEAQARIDARNAAKGKEVIQKSLVIIDVKSWGPDIDLDELATKLKEIEMDGLVWGAYTKVPIGYGVEKLQQTIVVEDEKVPSIEMVSLLLRLLIPGSRKDRRIGRLRSVYRCHLFQQALISFDLHFIYLSILSLVASKSPIFDILIFYY